MGNKRKTLSKARLILFAEPRVALISIRFLSSGSDIRKNAIMAVIALNI